MRGDAIEVVDDDEVGRFDGLRLRAWAAGEPFWMRSRRSGSPDGDSQKEWQYPSQLDR